MAMVTAADQPLCCGGPQGLCWLSASACEAAAMPAPGFEQGGSARNHARHTQRIGGNMEPHQNVAIMQRAYEAFNTGDMSTLTELMDETVWHLPGRSSMAGDYKGRGATLAYFGQLAQETEGTFRAELQHMAADGDDRVVGIQRSTADRDGKHLDVANCIVFELKDGKVTDGREHFEALYAWDEFWS